MSFISKRKKEDVNKELELAVSNVFIHKKTQRSSLARGQR